VVVAKTRNSDSLAFLFDLDGTLIDSVYQHVLAWREAAQAAGIELPVWRIQRVHADAYAKQAPSLRVLPGAQELLDTLADHRVPHAIATSGRMHSARHALKLLKLHQNVPVITRDDIRFAKPDPDLFVAAGKRLKVSMSRCVIVGDSVWDLLAARRAFALSVGLLSGGYGREELERAGAYRVYQDPADVLRHLDEVGVRL